jgi:Pyridoxamine 5'-phosphate oxidase
MSKFYSELTDELIKFIEQQKIFFTATAPPDGRINLSPKGMDTFRCLSRTQVAYLDLTGSGNETAAHLRENGRMTIMMCSFSDDPLILRLYGQGEVISPLHDLWPDLLAEFPDIPGQRQIILLSIESLQTSCGYAVPTCTEVTERPKLQKWAAKKGVDGINKYWQQKNRRSIDGLDTGIAPQIVTADTAPPD